MFERYTEEARRATFLAMKGADHLGAQSIEADHLLLGALNEATCVSRQFAAELVGAYDEIVRELAEAAARRPPSPGVRNLPLGPTAREALRHAEEWAARAGARSVTADHLFAGVLHVEQCSAARVLGSRGVTLDRMK
jgi:ATP-dependent Clp protease ATP-binding subunit ClpA